MATRAQFRIEVSDPNLAERLSNFLEHSIYRPYRSHERVISVTGPDGLSVLIARAELDLYLDAWRRLHPDASVKLID